MTLVIVMLPVIIVLALTFRLISLYHAGSFWFDETFTLYFARLPWAEAWQYLQFENSPPLHFFLAHIFVILFGQNETILRLTSVMMSLATMPVIYLLGKKIYSRSAGLIAALLFAVSGLSVFNAVEFRMYPLLILLTSASLYFFISYIENSKIKTLIILSLLNAVLLLTHLTAVMVVMIETLYIVWCYRKHFWNWCLYQIVPVATFLVWWLPSFLNRTVGDIANSWFFSIPFNPLYFFEQFYAFLIFPSPTIPTWVIVLIGFLLCLVMLRAFGAVTYIKEEQRWIFIPSSLKFGTCILFFIIVPVAFGFILNVQIPKQYSISLVPFVLLLGVAGSELIRIKKLHPFLGFVLVLCLIFLNYQSIWRKPYALDKLVEVIEQESVPQTEILAAAHIYTLPLELYYRGPLPVKPIYFGEDQAIDKMRLVRHNWHINYYSKEQLDLFLSAEAKLYTTILVVGTTNWQKEGDIVRLWFMNNGWRLEQTYSWEGYFNPDLHVFKKMAE